VGSAKEPIVGAPNQTQFFMAAAGVSTGAKMRKAVLFVVVAVAIGLAGFFLIRFAMEQQEQKAQRTVTEGTETPATEAVDPATPTADPAAAEASASEAAAAAATEKASAKVQPAEEKPPAPKAKANARKKKKKRNRKLGK